MKREKNTLYFNVNEKEKFFRAIRLLGRIKGYDSKPVLQLIKHEKAHIEAIEGNYKNSLMGYRLHLENDGNYYDIIPGIVRKNNIPLEDSVKISLAPENPSDYDFLSAIQEIYGKNLSEIELNGFLSKADTRSKLKQILLGQLKC